MDIYELMSVKFQSKYKYFSSMEKYLIEVVWKLSTIFFRPVKDDCIMHTRSLDQMEWKILCNQFLSVEVRWIHDKKCAFNEPHYMCMYMSIIHTTIKFYTTKLNSLHTEFYREHTDHLVQDCSNSIANALELLQFCTKPSINCISISYHPNITSITSHWYWFSRQKRTFYIV